MKYYKQQVNQGVIAAIELCLKSTSKSEMARTMGISPSKFSEILKERMAAGLDVIHCLCVEYLISADYIITGRGPMVRNPHASIQPDLPDVLIPDGDPSLYPRVDPTTKYIIMRNEELVRENEDLKTQIAELSKKQQSKKMSKEERLGIALMSSSQYSSKEGST